MNGKKAVRVALDVALTAMIVAEMFIQFTGVFLHEVIGFAFFATLATHLALSAKWIKSTVGSARRGSMGGRRKALAVMGILLAVNMVVLGASSIAISTILSSVGFEWAFGSYAAWAAVHAVSSYTLCALVALHLGMHWAFLASAFRVPYDPSRRRAINVGVNAVAAIGALALGMMAVRQAAPVASPSSASAATGDAGVPDARSDDADVFGSVSDVRADEGASSTSSGSAKGVRGAGKMGRKGADDSHSSDSMSNSDASTQESAPVQDEAPYYEEPSYEEGYDSPAPESDDSSTVFGTCTLCRKQCPLSAPQCDKPYRAGLL